MHILFVCLGNICRSPLAQGIMEQQLDIAGLSAQITADSCGTAAFNLGKHPDPRAIEAGLRAGYDISTQVSRQIAPVDFECSDFIIAMDRMNLMNTRGIAPADFGGEIELFGRYCQHGGNPQIADPYYEDANRFDALIPEMERAASGLLTYIRSTL